MYLRPGGLRMMERRHEHEYCQVKVMLRGIGQYPVVGWCRIAVVRPDSWVDGANH